MSESNIIYSSLNYIADKVDVLSRSWSSISISVWAHPVIKRISDRAPTTSFPTAKVDGPITMPLLLRAARTEFKKLERPAKESDFRWQGQKSVVL